MRAVPSRPRTRSHRVSQYPRPPTLTDSPIRRFERNPNRFAPASDQSVSRVVLIEDSPDYAALVEQMLIESFGEVDVRQFGYVREACDDTRGGATDCVLLDLGLPDAHGLDALELVQEAYPDIPVIVLSGREEEQMAVEAVYRGAQDYLVKRHTDRNLLSRSIRYAIERKRSELALAHLAMHDALTGLPNRTLFMDHLQHALARAERSKTSAAVLFLDLDRFKVINDSLGHAVGDKLLVQVGERLRGLIRPSDVLARFGGDEFLVLCEDLDSESQAMDIAERLSACEVEPYRVRRPRAVRRPQHRDRLRSVPGDVARDRRPQRGPGDVPRKAAQDALRGLRARRCTGTCSRCSRPATSCTTRSTAGS